MPDFTKLWDGKYLFGPNPAAVSRSDVIFLWAGALMVALAILAKILALRAERESPSRFLWNRFFHNFLTMGILVLLWAGARYENIPWLAAHIVVLGLLLIALIWLGFIGRYLFAKHRLQSKTWEAEKLKRKYLPR